MNRFSILMAVALFASTAACAPATEASGESAAEGELRSGRSLATGVQVEIDEHGVDRLAVVGRAGLKSGTKRLEAAQRAFDRMKRDYADYGTPEAYRFGAGRSAAFIVYVDAGDEAGYNVRVFDASDRLVLRGDAPSNSEPIDWTVVGAPVPEQTAASRKALADATKVVLEREGTSDMVTISRRQLATWGSPMERAQAKYDALAETHGEVSAFRGEIGDDTVFVLEVSSDEGADVAVFSAFDVCVLEGSAPSSSEPMDWEYRGLIEE